VGRVISVFKDRYIVETGSLQIQAEVSGRYRYLNLLKAEYPAVGDYVRLRTIDENLAIIEQLVQRKNVLDRVDVGTIQERQILAANIDLVFICLSLNKDFNLKKLENFLSLTEGKGFMTIILLTKKDLCDEIDNFISKVKAITLNVILVVSAFDKTDIENLRMVMKGLTSVFIGSSGVGKSTLINSLLATDYLKTNEIRLSDAQGRHTTVSRELIKLDETTAVIDTPGIRIVNAYGIDEYNFEDILSLGEGCKFRDCRHEFEVGCMVQKAIETGLLEEERLDAYNKAIKVNDYIKKREIERAHNMEKRCKKH
jgi:ribosome biogenesis GTPase